MLRRWLPTRTLARTSRPGALGLLAALVAVAATLQSVVPLLAAGTLDQSQTDQNQHGGTAPTAIFGGQTFTAGLTGRLDQVSISIARVGTDGNLTVEIRTVDGSGLPTTTILGSGTVPMSAVPACCPGAPIALTTIPLAAPAPVVAGTQYAIVFIPESPWTLYNSGANPYAGGQAVFLDLRGTAGWQPVPNVDLGFKTYVSTLVFTFTGFGAPIDNGIVNTARAGQTIPVKWRLATAGGTPVSDPASFVSVTSTAAGACGGGTPDDIETYVGNSGLQYLGDGNWQYNWATPKSYAGQCRTMKLTLSDGSTHTATFQFK